MPVSRRSAWQSTTVGFRDVKATECGWNSRKPLPYLGEQRAKLNGYNSRMGVSRCRVSFTDAEGIPHAVEVQADSLYEAVALAVAEFRVDALTATPDPMTEFTVSIQRPAIEHRIRLSQVSRWAEINTREGPAGVTKRQRVRALLENRMSERRI